MSRMPFLIFMAIIIIAISICILADFQRDAMISAIVGFVIGVAISVAQNNQTKDGEETKRKINIGDIIGICIVAGVCLALFFGLCYNSSLAAAFAFIGSVLGGFIGLMYEKK